MAIPVTPAPSPFVNLAMESEFIRACLQKPGFAQRLLARVPDEVFTNEVHSWLVGQIKSLMGQNRGKLARVPIEVIKHLTSSIEDTDKRAVYLQTIETLYRKPVEYEEFAESVIREYASYQALTSGIRDALSQYRRSPDVGRALETVDDSLRKSRAILSDADIYDYGSNWKERESARKVNTTLGVSNVRVKMGIPKMDEQIKIVPGTVTGLVAPFKRYKSVVLSHIAAAGVLQGYNVLSVTLENTVELQADRFDTMFTGINMKKVVEGGRSSEEEQQVEATLNRIANWPQRLKIMPGVAYQTSFMDVAAEIDRLEMDEGFSPELIVFDYANIARPSIPSKEQKENQDQNIIVWDAQNLAKRSKIQRAVVTAFQSKVEAVNESRMKNDQVGKSIGISQALDAAIAINQDANEKAIGIVTLSPMFIRYGPILHDHVTLESDFGRMTIDKGAERLLWGEVMSWEET